MTKKGKIFKIGKIFHCLCVVVAAVFLTLAVFLVLPVMQTINKPMTSNMLVYSVDTTNVPPPPPPPEEEPEKEQEIEETPPELTEQVTPLALEQLELALNPGFGEGAMGGDFAIKLNTVSAGGSEVDELFSIADLDQQPRAVYQPSPSLSKDIRKRAPGQVYIIFIVDTQGRVENPVVQNSTDPVFEKPALAAIRQWKFDPGKRNGQAVRFRMRVPFTFPKG